MDIYTQVISEQARKERGYRDIVEATEDNEVTKKVEKHNDGADAIHVASHEHHHAYAVGEGDTEDGTHGSLHDSKTGKTHNYHIPYGQHSETKIHKIVNKAVPGGIHKDLAKKIAHDHNENYED